jgi:hypothetical protein
MMFNTPQTPTTRAYFNKVFGVFGQDPVMDNPLNVADWSAEAKKAAFLDILFQYVMIMGIDPSLVMTAFGVLELTPNDNEQAYVATPQKYHGMLAWLER